MDIQAILVALDAEIEQLKRARALLAGVSPQPKRGRPAGAKGNKATSFNPAEFAAKAPKRRTMSAAARAKVAAAQRARWAALKAGGKKAETKPAATSPKKKSAAKKSKAATQA
jgi:hypothetical protein